MKKWKKYLFGIAAVGMICTGTACGNTKNSKNFQDSEKISIVTTIYPMYDFASNIAGDKAEIINLVPAGIEPHDFELSTGDMQLVEAADVFIYNGAGMEHFVDKTLKSVSNQYLVVVEGAKEIETIQSQHVHEQEESEEEHGEEGQTDPHTWLSIENAIQECEMIKNALVELDSENADYYEKNFETYKEKLEKLDEEYRAALTGLSNNTIVVAHEAFGYLCKEYGLEQEAVEGLTPDSEPDAARMK